MVIGISGRDDVDHLAGLEFPRRWIARCPRPAAKAIGDRLGRALGFRRCDEPDGRERVPTDLLLLNPKEIDDKRSAPTLVGRNLYRA